MLQHGAEHNRFGTLGGKAANGCTSLPGGDTNALTGYIVGCHCFMVVVYWVTAFVLQKRLPVVLLPMV
jgi:hypothetical protein